MDRRTADLGLRWRSPIENGPPNANGLTSDPGRSRVAFAAVVVLLAAVAIAGFAVWRANSGALPGGDRDGAILRALNAEAEAFTRSGTVLQRNARPPTEDSCDGRSETKGWTDEAVILQIAETNQPLRGSLERAARGAKWSLTEDFSEPYESRWVREVRPGVLAKLNLREDDQTHYTVVVSAQPPGPVVSGC